MVKKHPPSIRRKGEVSVLTGPVEGDVGESVAAMKAAGMNAPPIGRSVQAALASRFTVFLMVAPASRLATSSS